MITELVDSKISSISTFGKISKKQKKVPSFKVDGSIQRKSLNIEDDIEKEKSLKQDNPVNLLTDQSDKQNAPNPENINNIQQKKVEEILSKRRNFEGHTLKDLERLTDEIILEYDTRDCWTYFKDKLIIGHPILSIIFFKSLMEPIALRISHLFFMITTNLAFNAIFYTDDYIEETATLAIESTDVKFNI